MKRARVFLPQTEDAVRILGLEIARARRTRHWTVAQLSERCGISTGTLHQVEKGAPTVAIGIVFELAILLGIELFDAEPAQLSSLVSRGQDRLALLPARVRDPIAPVDDDF